MPPDSHHNVPYVIRSRRIMLGLSQARLAELVGRTATTVRRWERGEIAPPDDVVDQLAEALDVEAAQLRLPPPPARSSVVVTGAATPAPPTRAPKPATDREAPTRPAAAPVTRPTAPPRPAAPRPDGETAPQAPAGEPWVQFDGEPVPAAAAPPSPRPAPPAPPRPAPVPAPAAEVARPAPAEAVATATADPDATAAVPPPRRPVARPVAAPARSYLEDPKQRVLYGLRLILAVVALGVMAVIGVWAFGELMGTLDQALDFFSETTVVDDGLNLPTLPGAES